MPSSKAIKHLLITGLLLPSPPVAALYGGVVFGRKAVSKARRSHRLRKLRQQLHAAPGGLATFPSTGSAESVASEDMDPELKVGGRYFM